MSLRAIVAGLAAIIAFIPVANAQSMTTIWMVEPLPGIAGTTWQGKGGQIVWKQRLLPTALVEISSEFADPSDKAVSVAANTQAFEVQYPTATIFCATTRREGSKAQQFLAWSLPKQLCFVDLDRDGRFDAYFRPKSVVAGLPIISGSLPNTLKMIAPLAYRRVEPSQISRPFWIGFEYLGRPLGLAPSFTIDFGSEAAKGWLTDPVRLAGPDWPRTVEILGSKLTLFEAVDGITKITIDRPMPAQPFSVSSREYLMVR